MDRWIKFEALSALLHTKVRPIDKTKGEVPGKLLSVHDFLIGAIRIDNLFQGVPPLVNWYEKRITGESELPSYEEETSGLRSLLLEPLGPAEGKGRSDARVDKKQDGLQSGRSLRYAKEVFIDEDEFFAPEFDFDFTAEHEPGGECQRGEEVYDRPWGWYRMALKVLDKYPDGNTWLGTGGWRDGSSPGEWPVSYHGTSLEGALGIIKANYRPGDRAVFGRGIYSTPKLPEAGAYVTEFTSEKTNKTYKVIMQNRINPKERVKCVYEDYWLIGVPEDTSIEEEREIVTRSIRPYGVLIQEVKRDENGFILVQ